MTLKLLVFHLKIKLSNKMLLQNDLKYISLAKKACKINLFHLDLSELTNYFV